MEVNRDVDFEEMSIIKGAIKHPNFAKIVFSKFKSSDFENNDLGKIYRYLQKFYKKTGRIKDRDSLINDLKKDDSREKINEIWNLTIDNPKDLYEKANLRFKEVRFRNYLMKTSDYFQNGKLNEDKISNFVEYADAIRDIASDSLSGGNIQLSISGPHFCQFDFEPIVWYMFPIVSEASIILLAGDRGVGKSMFTMHLADKISKGRHFGPWHHIKETPINVLYIDGEMYYKELQDRLIEMNTNEHFRTISRTYIESHMTDIKCHLTDENFRELVREEIEKHNIKFVVFDNISSLTVGISENIKEDWDPINQYLLSLRSMGVTSLVVHHTGKTGLQRGTSGREDNVSLIIKMKYPKNWSADQGLRAQFVIEKNRCFVGQDNSELVRPRELSFKDNQWCFDVEDLSDSKDFMLDVLRNKTNKELASIYKTSTPTVSRRIKKLEDDGNITVTGNNRTRSVEVTEKGKLHLGDMWNNEKEYIDI